MVLQKALGDTKKGHNKTFSFGPETTAIKEIWQSKTRDYKKKGKGWKELLSKKCITVVVPTFLPYHLSSKKPGMCIKSVVSAYLYMLLFIIWNERTAGSTTTLLSKIYCALGLKDPAFQTYPKIGFFRLLKIVCIYLYKNPIRNKFHFWKILFSHSLISNSGWKLFQKV